MFTKVERKIIITSSYDQSEHDALLNILHSYVKVSIPIMIQYADKVASVHVHHYKEAVAIRNLFHDVSNELSAHLHKEEMILLLYVRSIL